MLEQFGRDRGTEIPGETYFDFINRVLASGNQTAIAVKISDLKDNRHDLEEGHQKDKYRFALALLEHAESTPDKKLTGEEPDEDE